MFRRICRCHSTCRRSLDRMGPHTHMCAGYIPGRSLSRSRSIFRRSRRRRNIYRCNRDSKPVDMFRQDCKGRDRALHRNQDMSRRSHRNHRPRTAFRCNRDSIPVDRFRQDYTGWHPVLHYSQDMLRIRRSRRWSRKHRPRHRTAPPARRYRTCTPSAASARKLCRTARKSKPEMPRSTSTCACIPLCIQSEQMAQSVRRILPHHSKGVR
jgi:hypothetical protein